MLLPLFPERLVIGTVAAVADERSCFQAGGRGGLCGGDRLSLTRMGQFFDSFPSRVDVFSSFFVSGYLDRCLTVPRFLVCSHRQDWREQSWTVISRGSVRTRTRAISDF